MPCFTICSPSRLFSKGNSDSLARHKQGNWCTALLLMCLLPPFTGPQVQMDFILSISPNNSSLFCLWTHDHVFRYNLLLQTLFLVLFLKLILGAQLKSYLSKNFMIRIHLRYPSLFPLKSLWKLMLYTLSLCIVMMFPCLLPFLHHALLECLPLVECNNICWVNEWPMIFSSCTVTALILGNLHVPFSFVKVL